MCCDEALELLSAALDGEIDPAQQAQLDEHLAQCPACRALRAELLGLEEALGALDIPAPAGLKDQIMENLPPQRARANVVYWRRWGAMAAAAALVLLGAWQLPRFALNPDKDVDFTEAVTYDAPAMDAAAQAPAGDAAVPTALNDDNAPLPPYVEGDGVNVNVQIVPQPDPSGADYTSYDVFADLTPEDAPEVTPALTASAAPVAPRKLDALSSKSADTAQVSGALIEGDAADTVTAGAGAQFGGSAPPPLSKAYSAKENASDLPVAEAAPETATFTAGLEELGQAVEPETSVEDILETTSQALDATAATQDPFVSYCGVLTLEWYEPTDQAFTVEFWEDGLRQYILSAGDFHALVERLDSQGLAYTLTTEGEGIAPDALCGLVVVPQQAPQDPAEAP